ncbi:MAG: AAA family ATPase, partial [Limisphaerales bacterium]
MAAKQQFLVVTGTGTGVGKTVLSGLLVRRLIRLGRTVRAFKPLCSGGRGDAQKIRKIICLVHRTTPRAV